MNASRRPGHPSRPHPRSGRRTAGRARSRAIRWRLRAALAAAAAVAILVAGCASFPASAPSFSAQPSLTPNVATLVTPTPQAGSTTSSSSSSSGAPDDPQSSVPTSSQTPTDPCAPSAPPVIATCLDAPWGLAPLPDEEAALVGERTTGKIFKVAPEKKPELIARVTDLDTTGGGGLLGIALSPYYAEDNLIYAYVSTPQDNRIVRIAPRQKPKAIFTGIPRGDEHNGGPIAFGADDLLYVATGDTGSHGSAADAGSLAGKVLRLDAFGKPAASDQATGTTPGHATTPASTTRTTATTTASTTTGTTPRSSTPTGTTSSTTTGSSPRAPAVYASGLTDPTGICPLPGGGIGVVDHRGTGDLLIPITRGKDYSHPASGDTMWRYQAGDGGAVDCAISASYLLATSLPQQKVTGIQMTPTGGFTGSPEDLAVKQFGRLRTIITGPSDLVWMTTSNKDGHGNPSPSDDRVVVLPAAGGGGGGGGAD